LLVAGPGLARVVVAATGADRAVAGARPALAALPSGAQIPAAAAIGRVILGIDAESLLLPTLFDRAREKTGLALLALFLGTNGLVSSAFGHSCRSRQDREQEPPQEAGERDASRGQP
jgi:hypothetical protein